MNTSKIELNPLLEDLENANINSYLKSKAFERLKIKLNLYDKWTTINVELSEERQIFINRFEGILEFNKISLDIAKRNVVIDDFEKLKRLFVYIYSINKNQIADIVIDFIERTDLSFEHIKEIKESLLLIKLSEDRIEKIRTLPNIQSLINESVLHIKDSKSSNDKISGQISLKKKWLRLISEAKYEKVIEEIRDIAIDEDKNEWLENILNISSRWHLLQEQIHKNIGNQADISTELNKINQALLNFIRNLNDTEEV